MAETLQQLADRGIQIANGQQYSITNGNKYTPVNNNASVNTLRQPTTRMSLSNAQAEANKAFSGLVAPMTTEEINAREEASKALTQQTAESIYNPQISREKQLGSSQVSTAEGVVGQRQGFNISTAEQAYVSNVENKVQDTIKEVENTKASYINQGNLAAAERADNQIQALREWNSQMVIAKANYALQIMSGNREQAGLDLQREKLGLETKAQEFNQSMAEKSLSLNIANLTGEYEGSPTFAAKQADISNALSEANLTGFYNGTETLESITTKAQLALQERGIEINEKQLAETIRNHKVSEALSQARLNQEDEEKGTPSGFVNDAIKRLQDLKSAGKLTTVNYNAERKIIGETIGWDSDSYGELENLINQAMQGDATARGILNAQANQDMGSDFSVNNEDVKGELRLATEEEQNENAKKIFGKKGKTILDVIGGISEDRKRYKEAEEKFKKETGLTVFPRSKWKEYGY